MKTFDELSDDAKERAREWFRKNFEFIHDDVIEDAADIAALFGLDIRQTLKTRADGSYHWVPSVYWSGFWNQGDGASFTGSYSYKAGGLKAVKAHAPKDEWLHAIVCRLQKVQRRHFYGLTADIKQNGRYCHEMTMNITVEVEEVRDALRDYARWIYRRLEDEYEYQNADEQVDEMLRINEYEFDEEGNRV